jgi:hypothetical protein
MPMSSTLELMSALLICAELLVAIVQDVKVVLGAVT